MDGDPMAHVLPHADGVEWTRVAAPRMTLSCVPAPLDPAQWSAGETQAHLVIPRDGKRSDVSS